MFTNPNVVSSYCVLDIETTGLSLKINAIIEIAILKVRDDKIVKSYDQLLFSNNIDPFITELTGISLDMVLDKPHVRDVEDEVKEFIGDDIIIGHNISFDINFLNAKFLNPIKNKTIDTLLLSRKYYPEMKHHRLSDMARYLNLSVNTHRSLADCITTKELYDNIKREIKIDEFDYFSL